MTITHSIHHYYCLKFPDKVRFNIRNPLVNLLVQFFLFTRILECSKIDSHCAVSLRLTNHYQIYTKKQQPARTGHCYQMKVPEKVRFKLRILLVNLLFQL